MEETAQGEKRSMNDRLLTVEELALYLGVPRATVYAWRSRGEGPPGYRIGKFVRFRLSEVEAWLETRRDEGTPPLPRPHAGTSPGRLTGRSRVG